MSDVRLIDANAADVERICCYYGGNCYIEDVKEWLDEQPTIEAVPVVHGQWVRSAGKSHIWYCSVCGDKINYKQNRRTYNIPKVPVEQKNKFCRNCGAKMDEPSP